MSDPTDADELRARAADALYLAVGFGILGYQRFRVTERELDAAVDDALGRVQEQLPEPASDLVAGSRELRQRVRRGLGLA